MVLNREEAAQKALESDRIPVKGMCQKWTRDMFEAPSVGDRDGDKDADAYDGWQSEPEEFCHYGDRNPPRGVPLYFKKDLGGGKLGFGHRSVSLGDGLNRTIDMRSGVYAPTFVSTETIGRTESVLGVEYVGWSETISGIAIPLPEPTRLQVFHSTAPRYNFKLLDNAASRSQRTDKRRISLIVKKVEQQVDRLPRDKDKSYVNIVRETFEEERVLRLGLLNLAVGRGRMGVPRQVRDQLRFLIKQLPKV